ncbi:MAG: ParB N-terminal domain-containing protein [Candidatus Bathyarchaeia archaeon]
MSRALPSAYSIRGQGGFRLDIALVEIDRLHLHEETLPEMLEALVRRIDGDGVLKAPVIVDRDTFVVLDGMHRVKALRSLDCRFICACLVDYMDPGIKVETWCRVVPRPFDLQKAVEIADELSIELAPRHVGDALDRGHVGLMMFRESTYELVTPDPSLLSAFDSVRRFELQLRARGFEVGYDTCRDAREKLSRGAVDAILRPPTLGKEQVVDVARRGRVFTFKATRHIVPARPVGVDVPLKLLREPSLTVEEVNERLSNLLAMKRLARLPAGSLWSGRRYDEDLYVFVGN